MNYHPKDVRIPAMGKRGLDLTFITKLEQTVDVLKSLDIEQEKLKAKLKTKTTEIDANMETLKGMLTEARKVVKMSIDQAGWREFGIEDAK